MAITGLENCLLFVVFLNAYLIIGTNKVQIGESLCLAQSV